MGHIFQDNRIREKSGRRGKPLVYQPAIPIGKALEIHNWTWKQLGMELKALASPAWIKALVEELAPIPLKADWKTVVLRMTALVGSDQYTPKKALQAAEKEGLDPSTLAALMAEYNRHIALTVYMEHWPRYESDPGRTRTLIEELLKTGTLMNGRFAHKDNYAFYRLGLNPIEVQELTIRVREIQGLIHNAELWLAFFKFAGVERISELKPSIANGYSAWRKAYRIHGTKGKAVSQTMVTRERRYLHNVFTYAVPEGRALFNPITDSIGPKKKTKAKVYSAVEKPFDLDTLSAMLAKLRSDWKEWSEATENDIKIRAEKRKNYLTVLFLLMTGARPSEVNKIKVEGGKIHFQGGKTKNSNRSITLTPGLKRVVEDPLFKDNLNTVNIDNRVRRYMQRSIGKEATPYRLRHSCCTLLLAIGEMLPHEIAFHMGHESSQISEDRYGAMGVFLKAGDGKDKVKQFWGELNNIKP